MELFKIFEDFSADGVFHSSSYIPAQRDLNSILPVKNTELCIEYIEYHSGLDRLDIISLVKDLLRWKDIEVVGEEFSYYTKKKGRFAGYNPSSCRSSENTCG